MNTLAPNILAEMEDAARTAMTAVRDRAVMKAACEDMDRISAEVRRQHGILDIGVQAIRELRDGE